MHRTDTLDMFVVSYGEIYLVTDTDEVLLRQGEGCAAISALDCS
jgi:hypothetical protein